MQLWTLHPKHLDVRGLVALWREALLAQKILCGATRGYRFDASKIGVRRIRWKMTETRGQLLYEWRHLKRKLKRRDVKKYRDLLLVKIPAPHPLFRIVPGRVRDWEKGR
jgi:hypothetical protein